MVIFKKDKVLKCGHIQINVKCCEKPKPCEELVDKKLICGHIQKNVKCCKRPKPCEELVDKDLPCGHIKELCYCYEKPENILCVKSCMRKFMKNVKSKFVMKEFIIELNRAII